MQLNYTEFLKLIYYKIIMNILSFFKKTPKTNNKKTSKTIDFDNL